MKGIFYTAAGTRFSVYIFQIVWLAVISRVLLGEGHAAQQGKTASVFSEVSPRGDVADTSSCDQCVSSVHVTGVSYAENSPMRSDVNGNLAC